MADLRSTAAAAITTTAAIFTVAQPASAQTVRLPPISGTRVVWGISPAVASGSVEAVTAEHLVTEDPSEFIHLTPADRAMLEFAMTTNVEEIDFDEFFIDDDDE